jgi:hypothetical protein
MNPSIGRRALSAPGWLALLSLVSSCSGETPRPTPSNEGPPPSEPEIGAPVEELSTSVDAIPLAVDCGVRAYVDENGETRKEPTFFVVNAIERKLRRHPDFAAAFGRQQVRDCATARAYFDAYHAYYESHPGFDDHDADEVLIPPPPGPPPGPPPDLSKIDVQKIINGDTNIFSSSTVMIETLQWDPNDPDPDQEPFIIPCTATFIARNWLITAAHCAGRQKGDELVDGGLTPLGDLKPLTAWRKWRISVQDNGNPPVPRRLWTANEDDDGFMWVNQIIHPQYSGNLPPHTTSADSFFDVALAYVYAPYYDAVLLKEPRLSSPPIIWTHFDGPIAMPDPLPGDTAFVLGIGPTVSDAGSDYPKRLGRSPTLVSIDQVFPNILQQQAAPANPVRLCQGDSGGPFLRTFRNSNGAPVRNAMLGVSSAFTGGDLGRPECTRGWNASGTNGGINIWARVDNKTSWIDQNMRHWNGKFWSCRRFRSLETPGSTHFVECFGKSCGGKADCPNIFLGPDLYSQSCYGLDRTIGIDRGECRPAVKL